MHPYQVSVHELKTADAPQHIQFCVWLFTAITMSGLDVDLFFTPDKTLFYLNGYVNS